MVHKHTGNNMHLTLTAVIVPTSKNYNLNVLSQHFVQLYKQMPVNANDILLNYGKRMQAHDIKTDAKASHKINRDVLRNDHVLLCKELGLTIMRKTTTHVHNLLYNAFVTVTDQNSNIDVSCVSVYT